MAKHGDWYWHELLTTDAEGAKAFYKAVCGWASTPMEGQEGYSLATNGPVPVAGVMGWDSPAGSWRPFIAVRDIQTAKAAVETGGGKIEQPPTETAGVGTWMICTDPQGATFALIQPAGGVED